MVMIRTAHGLGEVVETKTQMGRKSFKVAIDGNNTFWVNEREASLGIVGEDLFSYAPEMEAFDQHEKIPGVPDHTPSKPGHGMYGQRTASREEKDEDFYGDHLGASSFDFEPSLHTWDNSTTLPYDPTPQFPVDMFRDEQTISPDHEIDLKDRMRATDSRSFEKGEDRPYPGPNPDLFAKHEGTYERPAGLDARYADVYIDAADHYNDPVQRFRDDAVGEIQRVGYVDISAGLDEETGDEMRLVEADKLYRCAAWRDVRAKGVRLRREGQVHVKDMSYDRIYASVNGDNGTYETMIAKGGDYGQVGGQSISNWRCSCKWGQWAFKRQMTYVGRLCSHGYATYLTMQSQHAKEHASHPFNRRRLVSRTASVLDDFKTWVKENNGGHIDLDAADTYLATRGDTNEDQPPLGHEDAAEVLKYVDTHHSERPARNYDQKSYSFDPDDNWEKGDYDPVDADVLRSTPRSLKPDTYVVSEGDGEGFTDLGDDRKTTGPDQIMGRRTAATGEEGHHPAFAWHDDKGQDFPENGIVHFSALTYTADENLLQKLRDMSEDTYEPGNMQDRNREISEVVKELRDRGYDADQFVASLRTADEREDGYNGGSTPPPAAPTPGTSVSDATNAFDPIGNAANPGSGVTAPSAQFGEDNGPHGIPGGAPTSYPGEDNGPHGAPGSGNDPTPTGSGPIPPSGAPAGHGIAENTPPPAANEVTVKPGDTLSGIDEAHGMGSGAGAYNDVAKSNGISDPNVIQPGQKLNMPGENAGGIPGANAATSGVWDAGAGGAASPGGGFDKAQTPAGGAAAGGGWGGIGGGKGGVGDAAKGLGGGVGGSALSEIKASKWAARYFQAEDEGGDSSDDKSKGGAGGAAAGAGIFGPGAPAAGPLPTAVPGPSLGNEHQPLSAPALAPGANGASAPGAAPGSDAVKKQEQPAGGAGGLGGGLGGAMGQIAPVIGDVMGQLPGLIGDIGSGIGGLTKLLSVEDPRSFAASYFKSADGNFLGDGGGDWADYPFAGSGPVRTPWRTTSEDYVNEHERPHQQETWTTDNDGDIVKHQQTQPKQASLADLDADLSPSAREFWADAFDPSEQGYFNPRNRPYQEDDSSQYQPQHGKPGRPGPQGPPQGGGDMAGPEGELGEVAEMAPELAMVASYGGGGDDQSDIVRQFHANGAGALGRGAGGGGAFGDDAIAANAQRMLRTAGRNYTPAQQREMEDEFHPLGARNLPDLDLTGTHYE